MLDFPRWKVWSISLVILIGILFAIPSMLPADLRAKYPTWLPSATINLGLDLAEHVGEGLMAVLGGVALWVVDPPLRGEGETKVGAVRVPIRTWFGLPFLAVCLTALATTLVLSGSDIGFVAAMREFDAVAQLGLVLLDLAFDRRHQGAQPGFEHAHCRFVEFLEPCDHRFEEPPRERRLVDGEQAHHAELALVQLADALDLGEADGVDLLGGRVE